MYIIIITISPGLFDQEVALSLQLVWVVRMLDRSAFDVHDSIEAE